MILEYRHIIYLIANIFRVFSINLFLETIFSKNNLRCSQELKRTIFILYYGLAKRPWSTKRRGNSSLLLYRKEFRCQEKH